ncbi:AMP-binding protein [Candidatus Lokiarchaeum ossiferum]|uniref:AMP-binding protein n=1 Tax=Candidatus Lokiarchaeum ossiferum TaxID=2951803 RepID=UPI00352D8E34
MAIDNKILTEMEKNLTIGGLIDIVAGLYPTIEAAVFDNLRKTWKELHEDIEKLAIGLQKLGLKKGERAGVWALNIYEWIVAWFALPKIGVTLIPMDSWYKPHEAKFIMHHSESVAIICTSDYIPMVETFRSEVPDLRNIVLMDNPEKVESEMEGIVNMKDVMNVPLDEANLKALHEVQDSINKDDVTFILYTSGTTGTPKGAQLTHYNIIRNTVDTANVMQCGPSDKYLIPVPFSHCFGNTLGITTACLTGSTMIPLLDQTPSIAMKKVMDEGVTVAHGTPTHFMRYLRYLKDHPEIDVSHLRTGIIAGAPCPPDTLKGIINEMQMQDIIIGYGLTEASPIITLTKPDDSFENRVESVGQAIPDIDVRIFDDDNEEVAIGEKGELVVKGYNVMKGYLKSEFQPIDDKGYLHTGDLATVDENGYFKIVGRKKDMVIYGGFNVYPKVVENFLIQHPDIMEVAVVGVPDKEYGELVAAVVHRPPESKLTEQDVVDYCYGKINSPSVPRFVNFDVELPLSGRGKIQKYKLRDTLTDMLKAGKLGPKMVPSAVKNKKK